MENYSKNIEKLLGLLEMFVEPHSHQTHDADVIRVMSEAAIATGEVVLVDAALKDIDHLGTTLVVLAQIMFWLGYESGQVEPL